MLQTGLEAQTTVTENIKGLYDNAVPRIHLDWKPINTMQALLKMYQLVNTFDYECRQTHQVSTHILTNHCDTFCVTMC